MLFVFDFLQRDGVKGVRITKTRRKVKRIVQNNHVIPTNKMAHNRATQLTACSFLQVRRVGTSPLLGCSCRDRVCPKCLQTSSSTSPTRILPRHLIRCESLCRKLRLGSINRQKYDNAALNIFARTQLQARCTTHMVVSSTLVKHASRQAWLANAGAQNSCNPTGIRSHQFSTRSRASASSRDASFAAARSSDDAFAMLVALEATPGSCMSHSVRRNT